MARLFKVAPVTALMAVLLCFALAVQLEAGEKEAKPATLKVSGYGFFGNRNLKQTLNTLLVEKEKPEFFDTAFIEDAALIIFARLNDEGFLQPRLLAEVTLADGSEATYLWDQPVEHALPSGLRAKRVRFIVREGARYYFERLQFVGLETIDEKRARSFFVETGALLPLRRFRIYTPKRLDRGLRSLTEILHRQGYQAAQVQADEPLRNDKKGEVAVTIRVRQGPKFVARSVREQVYFGTNAQPDQVRGRQPLLSSGKDLDVPYSRIWEQDYAQMLRTNYYGQGYPDASVEMTVLRQATNAVVDVHASATVRTGPQINVHQVKFIGNERTRRSVLDRRVPLEPGALLNRIEAEKGRLRLSRLGVFESVQLSYEPVDDRSRDLIYRVDEGKRIDLSLLFGYGSYELLRGGFDVEQKNVFGRAHHSRLRAIQSFKSSSGNYTYTMPELLGVDWDVFIRGFGLRREEISFTRVEYGGGAGMQRLFRSIDSTIALRYDYQVLSATEAEVDVVEQGVESPAVGAFTFDVRHDRRNNPLYPERGYKIFSNLELASEYLAGDVDYQRFELAGSYHWTLGNTRRMHFGLTHGFIASIGTPQEDVPFTRRFFLGGENSIRGYQEGEASPRNDEGDAIGAESYVLGTVEFEQALTPRWSLVIFSDNLGIAEHFQDYPLRQALFSVGGGIRWKTIVGPVRLEYGHNLNPREDDPSGTIHFSLGFPF